GSDLPRCGAVAADVWTSGVGLGRLGHRRRCRLRGGRAVAVGAAGPWSGWAEDRAWPIATRWVACPATVADRYSWRLRRAFDWRLPDVVRPDLLGAGGDVGRGPRRRRADRVASVPARLGVPSCGSNPGRAIPRGARAAAGQPRRASDVPGRRRSDD